MWLVQHSPARCGILSALKTSNKRWQTAAILTAASVAGSVLVLAGFTPCGKTAGCSEQVNTGATLAAPLRIEPAAREPEPLGMASFIARPSAVTVSRVDDDTFKAALHDEPLALGAIAIGRPNRGALFNAVQLSNDDPRWKLEVPEQSFGTEETVRAIEAAIAEVNRLFPGTRALSVGHLSSKHGGWLRPHRSHQNGRDVDLGFYYIDDSPWYRKATMDNLDVPRTWALLSALERAGGLEYAFLDRSLHQVLRKHAESIGESAEFLQHMFDGPLPQRGPTIRHARGHLTHLHVRFTSPIAVENAHRARVFTGKAGRNTSALAQALRGRQAKPRYVADRPTPKSRNTRRGEGRGRGATASRTKVL
jgi:murein endopeptidase